MKGIKSVILIMAIILMFTSCIHADSSTENAYSDDYPALTRHPPRCYYDESAPPIPREKIDLITELMPLAEMVNILGKAHGSLGSGKYIASFWIADNGETFYSFLGTDQAFIDFEQKTPDNIVMRDYIAKVALHGIPKTADSIIKPEKPEEETTAETSYVYQPPIIPSKPLETVAKEETK